MHFADTPAERNSVSQDIDRTARMVSEKWTKYLADGVDPGEERRLADATGAAWKRYDATLRRYVELENAGSEKEADALLLGDCQKAAGDFHQAISDSIAFQGQQGTDAVKDAADTGLFARTMIIVVLCLMSIICAAIGWLMVHGISAPISTMTSAMTGLAQRDLTTAIPGVGRGDEIGGMAQAVQVFKDR